MTLSRLLGFIIVFLARLITKHPATGRPRFPQLPETACGEVLPFLAHLSELAPSGAQVEGLIQAARCRMRSLTSLLAPAVSGLYWPGGLDSPIISSIQFKSSKQARTALARFDPVGGRGPNCSPNASGPCCQEALVIFLTPIEAPIFTSMGQYPRYKTVGSRGSRNFLSPSNVAPVRSIPVRSSYSLPMAAGLFSRVNPRARAIS